MLGLCVPSTPVVALMGRTSPSKQDRGQPHLPGSPSSSLSLLLSLLSPPEALSP